MFPNSVTARCYDRERIRDMFVAYLLDLIAFALSGLLAFLSRFDGMPSAIYLHPMLVAVCIWAGVKSVAFIVGGVSGGYWRYNSIHEAVRIIFVNSAGSILAGTIILVLLGRGGVPRSVYVLEWMVSCILTLGGRLAVRVVATTEEGRRGRRRAGENPYLRCWSGWAGAGPGAGAKPVADVRSDGPIDRRST